MEMFNKQIAAYYARKALKEVTINDFDSIIKSLKWLRKSFQYMPPSPELEEMGKKIKSIMKEHETILQEKLDRK